MIAPEYYERAPDGARWPGTLDGLLEAIEDTALTSVLAGDQEITLIAVRDGIAAVFRTYTNGREQT